MGRYKILYLPIAERDLADILEYVSRDRPSAVSGLLDAIDEGISRLEEFPFSGVVPADASLQRLGYRLIMVGNILIFYVVKKKSVEIRRILHGARRYEFLL